METSAAIKEHSYRLLRTLIRSSFFGDHLPPERQVIQRTRIPRHAVMEALERLIEETILEKDGDTFRRNPATQKNPSGRVAFLLNSNIFESWYGIFQDYLIGFEETMVNAGYGVLYRAEFRDLSHKIHTVEEFRAAGIKGIALGSYAEPQLRHYINDHQIPAVVLGNATIDQQEIGSVCTDNFGGMAQAVHFLHEKHHRHIALYVAGSRSHDGFRQRQIGYDIAMRSHGLMPLHDMVFGDPHNGTLARRACIAFQGIHPRPTAIVCGSDREAFELMSEFHQSGIKVPQDVSVCGFDNNIYGGITEPALTTMEIHGLEMGSAAGAFLLNEIQQPQMPVRILIPTDLLVRDSVRGLEESPAGKASGKTPAGKTQRMVVPEDASLLHF
jgi:LacI family transcriptional regulator